ncbi:MAG: thiamine phosphate synthase [Deltaproteobacteria bacterium]|nr:thiamine phosphate synthase [Deltaproteobacteria bacterium]
MRREDLALYVVTDPSLAGSRGVEATCALALAAGPRVIQLRDKVAPTRVLVEQARRLVALCARHDAILILNDRLDVALAAGAHGVHLGQDDLPAADARRLIGSEGILGLSVRTPEEARAAEEVGADYIAANLVFSTSTKTDLEGPIGLEGVRALRRATRLPLVAIGGIHPGNAADVVAAGADGVAVVSAVMAAPDVGLACRALLGAVEVGRARRAAG